MSFKKIFKKPSKTLKIVMILKMIFNQESKMDAVLPKKVKNQIIIKLIMIIINQNNWIQRKLKAGKSGFQRPISTYVDFFTCFLGCSVILKRHCYLFT